MCLAWPADASSCNTSENSVPIEFVCAVQHSCCMLDSHFFNAHVRIRPGSQHVSSREGRLNTSSSALGRLTRHNWGADFSAVLDVCKQFGPLRWAVFHTVQYRLVSNSLHSQHNGSPAFLSLVVNHTPAR